MNLETPNITIKKSQKKLFEFLCDLNNFEQLMPENTQKFEVDGDSFIFGLKGMPEIRLVLQEKTAYNQIVLGAASSKLPFRLTANINEIDEANAEANLKFEGDFNPMMAMMIKKPLQKFIDTLSENIEKL
ncbi:MAG: carbon monoxide dehydrogenase subunit G [Urechidicola sp.]|jgi:carbon monoxide dehydrogenase subunit G|tara:strand:- start:4756 stop:5145 length:390 start_codon:yes stop_codon:yes gene_type:complete